MTQGSGGAVAEAVSPPHRNCSQLNVPGLADGTMHSFVHGLDDVPRELDAAAIAAELQDPFAARLLGAGVFPSTAGDLLDALAQADPGGPLSLHRFFLVGEGSQIAASPTIGVGRNMRFLVTCGRGPDGPDVIVSSFHPDQGMVEVIAWDLGRGGFNFYRTMPGSSAWLFAGNSRHALVAPTRGSGPFESHVNGHFLMKEFVSPWVHWHSPFATVAATVLADQGLDTHPWVGSLDPGGAYTLEDDAARPATERWTTARVQALLAGTAEETPARMLEQLLTTLTVTLVSSFTSSAAALSGSVGSVDLPASFFVDSGLVAALGLPPPPSFSVSAATYAATLGALDVHLTDGGSFRRAGDTHFAFVVPDRSFEDVETLRQAVAAGLLTPRLVACLMMVDHPNPVFSERRSALLRHVPETPFSGDGAATSEAVADAIRSSVEAATPGSPEAEFAELWAVGDDFMGELGERLIIYYDAVAARLATPEGFRAFYELAESRRDLVREMPIAESELLFSRSAVTPARRRMRPDATVEVVPT